MQAMQGQFPQTASAQQLNPFQQFEFFVDDYSDDQIQEIISIFRNDFKPPKNLWIEKSAESCFFNSPDFYADIYAGAIEQFNQQQMILQQKQQQELQDQVSNGTTSSHGSALSDAKPGQGQSSGGGKVDRDDLSPPVTVDKSKEEMAKQEQKNEEVQKKEQEKQEPPKEPNEIENKKAEEKAPPNSKVEEKADGKPEIDFQEQEQNAADAKQDDEKKSMKFDPATDLNIFEQFNFDEMNINIEDINQNNQKQDVINSSDSDIGGLVGGQGANVGLEDGDDEVEAARMLESEEVEEDEDSQDCTREDNILRQLEELENQKAAQNQLKEEKYMQLGKLGTELQVIESMSNEVSASAESQKTGDIANASRVSETLSKNTQSQYSSHNKMAKLRSQDDDFADDGIEGLPPSHQDFMLEEIERKNSKTLQMIQQEKRNQ